MAKVQARLDEMQAQFDAAMAQKQLLETDAAACQRKMDSAAALLHALAGAHTCLWLSAVSCGVAELSVHIAHTHHLSAAYHLLSHGPANPMSAACCSFPHSHRRGEPLDAAVKRV